MELYLFGQKIGIKSILRGHIGIGLKRLVLPIDYWRYPLFTYVLSYLKKKPKFKVLDIGSPKLLALYLAVKMSYEVYAADI